MLLLSLLAVLAASPGEPKDTRVVLLLDDLSVVEAEPVKDGYAIRRGKALEPVAAGRIKFVGDSKAAVHRYLLAQSQNKPVSPPAVGFVAGSLPLFAARVQPVLMNRCAACHAHAEYPGRFKLARIPEGFADPDATVRNARASALMVDRLSPVSSPLLTFAASPHGGSKTVPLNRTHLAYRPLEQWVAMNAGPQSARTAPAPGPAPVVSVSPHPVARPPVGDPTDPGPFNRVMHPVTPR